MTVKELKEFLSNVPDDTLVGFKEDGYNFKIIETFEYKITQTKNNIIKQLVLDI